MLSSSIHFPVNGMVSPLWLNNTPLCLYVTFLYVFICWWAARLIVQLGYYEECYENMGVQVSLWHADLHPFWYTSRSGITGSFGSSIIFFFWGTSILTSTAAVLIYIPPTVCKHSFSPILSFLISLWGQSLFPDDCSWNGFPTDPPAGCPGSERCHSSPADSS
jgi:hypothetical protein